MINKWPEVNLKRAFGLSPKVDKALKEAKKLLKNSMSASKVGQSQNVEFIVGSGMTPSKPKPAVKPRQKARFLTPLPQVPAKTSSSQSELEKEAEKEHVPRRRTKATPQPQPSQSQGKDSSQSRSRSSSSKGKRVPDDLKLKLQRLAVTQVLKFDITESKVRLYFKFSVNLMNWRIKCTIYHFNSSRTQHRET
jgi:BRCT domain type II-containing protein